MDPPAPPDRARRLGVPLGRDADSVRRRIDSLERLLEHSIPVPGTSRSVGLDAVVGLIPVAGDIFGAVMGAYLVLEASLLGLPKWKLLRMAGNVAIDSAIGAIPVAGDVFDFAFRSNTRNVAIIRRHLDKHHPLIEQ